MKTYCILEQGDRVGEEVTIRKKEMFSTSFSDFYRLNWKREDPNAYIEEIGVTWSEGRSIIYDRVPKKYKYYIFIDDDVTFNTENSDVPSEIKRLLNFYEPINATFFNKDSWSYEFMDEEEKQNLNREAFPIGGFDLQAHILKSSFADICFPAIYHGAAKSLWYPQWFCHVLKPLKQMCFTTVQVSNQRSEGQGKSTKSLQYSDASKIMWMFNKNVKIKRKFKSQKDILSASKNVYKKDVDKKESHISYGEIFSIYKNNKDLQNRSQKPDLCYKIKNTVKDYEWRVSRYLGI